MSNLLDGPPTSIQYHAEHEIIKDQKNKRAHPY